MRSMWLAILTIGLGLSSWGLRAQDADSPDDEPRRSTDDTGDERPLRSADKSGEPGYLGLVADDRRDRGRGVRVIDLSPNGPAISAGMLVDDLIVTIDGQPVRQMDDLAHSMQSARVGTRMKFDILRQGVRQSVELELGKRPAVAAPAARNSSRPPAAAAAQADVPPRLTPTGPPTGARLGVRTMPLTEPARQQFNLPADARGAVVAGVTIDSPADKARIPTGALITAVDDQPVNVPEDLGELIRRAGPGKEVEITFLARGEETKKRVTLAGRATGTPATGDERRPLPKPSSRGSSPEALEARVRELESRLDRIEAKLDRGR